MDVRIITAAGRALRPLSASVRLALEFVEANWAGAVTLDLLARAAYCSKYHLVRKFRAEIGHTPHHYLLLRRLDGARDLLLEGVPPSRVAYACGFADQAHLTRQFGERFGMPPAAYVRAAGSSCGEPVLVALPSRSAKTARGGTALPAGTRDDVDGVSAAA